MGRRKQPKTKNLRRHSAMRMSERYDLALTNDVRQEIVRLIQTGKSEVVYRQSHRVVIHDVKISRLEEPVRVVYDKTRKEIITVLPSDVPVRRQVEEEGWIS